MAVWIMNRKDTWIGMKIPVRKWKLQSPGSKIPPVRELAIEAGVNPNTMQKALQTLESEGILYSQRTSGRFVAETVDDSVREKICDEVMKKFTEHMYDLGFSDEDIVKKTKDYLKKNPSKTGGSI